MDVLHSYKGVLSTFLQHRFVITKLNNSPVFIQLSHHNKEEKKKNSKPCSLEFDSNWCENKHSLSIHKCLNLKYIREFLDISFIWKNERLVCHSDLLDGEEVNFDAISLDQRSYWAVLVWQGNKPLSAPVFRSNDLLVSESCLKVPVERITFNDPLNAIVYANIHGLTISIPFSFDNVIVNGYKHICDFLDYQSILMSGSIVGYFHKFLNCDTNKYKYICYKLTTAYLSVCQPVLDESFQNGDIYIENTSGLTKKETVNLVFYDVKFTQIKNNYFTEISFEIKGKSFKLKSGTSSKPQVKEGFGHIIIHKELDLCQVIIMKALVFYEDLFAQESLHCKYCQSNLEYIKNHCEYQTIQSEECFQCIKISELDNLYVSDERDIFQNEEAKSIISVPNDVDIADVGPENTNSTMIEALKNDSQSDTYAPNVLGIGTGTKTPNNIGYEDDACMLKTESLNSNAAQELGICIPYKMGTLIKMPNNIALRNENILCIKTLNESDTQLDTLEPNDAGNSIGTEVFDITLETKSALNFRTLNNNEEQLGIPVTSPKNMDVAASVTKLPDVLHESKNALSIEFFNNDEAQLSTSVPNEMNVASVTKLPDNIAPEKTTMPDIKGSNNNEVQIGISTFDNIEVAAVRTPTEKSPLKYSSLELYEMSQASSFKNYFYSIHYLASNKLGTVCKVNNSYVITLFIKGEEFSKPLFADELIFFKDKWLKVNDIVPPFVVSFDAVKLPQNKWEFLLIWVANRPSAGIFKNVMYYYDIIGVVIEMKPSIVLGIRIQSKFIKIPLLEEFKGNIFTQLGLPLSSFDNCQLNKDSVLILNMKCKFMISELDIFYGIILDDIYTEKRITQIKALMVTDAYWKGNGGTFNDACLCSVKDLGCISKTASSSIKSKLKNSVCKQMIASRSILQVPQNKLMDKINLMSSISDQEEKTIMENFGDNGSNKIVRTVCISKQTESSAIGELENISKDVNISSESNSSRKTASAVEISKCPVNTEAFECSIVTIGCSCALLKCKKIFFIMKEKSFCIPRSKQMKRNKSNFDSIKSKRKISVLATKLFTSIDFADHTVDYYVLAAWQGLKTSVVNDVELLVKQGLNNWEEQNICQILSLINEDLKMKKYASNRNPFCMVAVTTPKQEDATTTNLPLITAQSITSDSTWCQGSLEPNFEGVFYFTVGEVFLLKETEGILCINASYVNHSATEKGCVFCYFNKDVAFIDKKGKSIHNPKEFNKTIKNISFSRIMYNVCIYPCQRSEFLGKKVSFCAALMWRNGKIPDDTTLQFPCVPVERCSSSKLAFFSRVSNLVIVHHSSDEKKSSFSLDVVPLKALEISSDRTFYCYFSLNVTNSMNESLELEKYYEEATYDKTDHSCFQPAELHNEDDQYEGDLEMQNFINSLNELEFSPQKKKKQYNSNQIIKSTSIKNEDIAESHALNIKNDHCVHGISVFGRIISYNCKEGIFLAESKIDIYEETCYIMCYFNDKLEYLEKKQIEQKMSLPYLLENLIIKQRKFGSVIYPCDPYEINSIELNFAVGTLWDTEEFCIFNKIIYPLSPITVPINTNESNLPLDLSLENAKSSDYSILEKTPQLNLEEMEFEKEICFKDVNCSLSRSTFIFQLISSLNLNFLSIKSRDKLFRSKNLKGLEYEEVFDVPRPPIPVSGYSEEMRDLARTGVVIQIEEEYGMLLATNQKVLSFSRDSCFLYGICLYNISLLHILKLGFDVEFDTDIEGGIDEVRIGGIPQSSPEETYRKICLWCKTFDVKRDVMMDLIGECEWIPSSCDPVFVMDDSIPLVALD